MKITYVTGHFCKECYAILDELAMDLGEYGAEVTVITGFPSRRINSKVKNYYLNHPIEKVSPNVTVKRVGSRKGEGEGLFQRMLRYIPLTMAIYREAKKTPTDVYYLYSSPPFIGWIGILLAKKAPTLYNAQDLFPDTLIKVKSISEKNLLVRFCRFMEKKVYRENTHIITISNEMKETIKLAGCPESKISVIYNWADVEEIEHVPRNRNNLMDELGIDKSKFIISYAGNIGLFQGWSVITEAARKVERKNSKIHFVIIGNGEFKRELEQEIKEKKIHNISLFPLQSFERLSEIYSIGDLELVPIEPGVTRMAMPSKVFYIMAAGAPLLSMVDQCSDIANIIKEKNMGYTLEHGDADALVQVILKAYDNRTMLSTMGKKAREFCEREASRKVQTKKYYEKLNSLVHVYSDYNRNKL